MNKFIEILYLVYNEGLKFLLLEELSDQRATRKCIYFPCSCQEAVEGWLSTVYQRVGSDSEMDTI